jgi:hypothetical protein
MANEDIAVAAIDNRTRRSEGTPPPLKRWRLLRGGWGSSRFVMQSPSEPAAPKTGSQRAPRAISPPRDRS